MRRCSHPVIMRMDILRHGLISKMRIYKRGTVGWARVTSKAKKYNADRKNQTEDFPSNTNVPLLRHKLFTIQSMIR
jgi:hypothetical protein